MSDTGNRQRGTVAVATTELTKVFGHGPAAVRAVDGMTVGFASARFTAIMGPSGSGKSTLMHCLAGLEAPTSGTVRLAGKDTSALSDTALTVLRRERVGFLFQSFNLLPTLSAEQNILLPLSLAGRKDDRAWFNTLVGALGLGDRLRHRPDELSVGQRQRVAAARALITRPEVVFADEPTGALDSRSGAELLGFLHRSIREFGQTVVMVTHDPIAATYADRVVLLADGRLAGELAEPTSEAALEALRALGEREASPLTVLTVTLSVLRGHTGRLVGVSLSIVIGAAFVAATLVVGATLRSSVQRAVAAQAIRADVAVIAPAGNLDRSTLARIEAVPGVRATAAMREEYMHVNWPDAASLTRLATLPGPRRLRVTHLETGRLPRPGERAVAVDAATARKYRLDLGGQITLRSVQALEGQSGRPEAVRVRVVGVLDLSSSPLAAADLPTLLARGGAIAAWTDGGITRVYALAAPGVSGTELVSRVDAAVGAVEDVTVRTGDEQGRVLVAQATGGTNVVSGILLTFAVIALFVAALVIGNTFNVLVAQRTRQLALLRCVGATRRQVFRSVLVEAGLLGVTASLVGVAVGVGLVAVGVAVASPTMGGPALVGLSVPARAVLVPLAVGVTTTVIAALLPARAATRVPPVAALRVGTAAMGRRAGRVRVIAGALLSVVGFGLLAVGAFARAYPLGVLGGVVSAAGVLLLARRLVPAALGRLRAPLRALGGPPGKLAAQNATRNPARAAAAATALLVGVTLISAVLVGAATARASVAHQIDTRYPVDLGVIANDQPLKPSLTSRTRRLPGVTKAAVLPGTTAHLDGRSRTVLGVGPSARRLARGESAEPTTGTVLVPPAVVRNSAVTYSDTLLLSRGSRDVRLRVRRSPAHVSALLVTPATLARLDPTPTPRAQWLRATGGADASAVIAPVRQAVNVIQPGATLNGALRVRAAYEGALDVALLVVAGLLGISVLIAVIGIADTLALSVLERTRETALLRALGLTRRQLAASLAWEAALLALVAGLLGAALGCAYGVAGSYSLLGFEVETIVPHIPGGRLALVVVIAVCAGVAASVLPARRAVRMPPAAGLTDE